MKTLILATTMLMFCFLLKGQDIKSDSTKYVYCQLVGTSTLLTNKVIVNVDFGEKTNFFQGTPFLKGEDGKLIKFNSMVDALNYMGKDNWEFVQAYALTIGNSNVYHFLLKKQTSLIEQEK